MGRLLHRTIVCNAITILIMSLLKSKIAMAYITEDLLDFWQAADFKVTKGEVSNVTA